MKDYKNKYKELLVYLVIITVLYLIFSTMVSITINNFKQQINEKDERIWQLEVEKEDLQEQIYILENREEIDKNV